MYGFKCSPITCTEAAPSMKESSTLKGGLYENDFMYHHSFIQIFLSLPQSNCWTVSLFTGEFTEVSASFFCLLDRESGSARGLFMMSQIRLTRQHNRSQSQIRVSVRAEEICTFSTRCENSLIMSGSTSIMLHAEAPTFGWRNEKEKHI